MVRLVPFGSSSLQACSRSPPFRPGCGRNHVRGVVSAGEDLCGSRITGMVIQCVYIYYYIILYYIVLYYIILYYSLFFKIILYYFILYIILYIYMMSKNVQDIQTWQCNAVPNFWHSLEMLLAPSTVLSCPLPLDHPTIRFHTACQGGDLIVVVVLLVSFPWIEIWLISYIIEICRNM